MADRIKDAEDYFLESVLRPESIADDGFSNRVVATIRRRIWLRRLTVPIATLIGGAVAFKPVYALALAANRLLAAVPVSAAFELPVPWLAQLQTIVFGAVLLMIALLAARLATD
jgi:hypothetical protein